MALPPGPLYLLRLIPTFAVPSFVVYIALTLLRFQGFSIPLLLVVPAVVLAQPVYFLLCIHYKQWSDNRIAASLGAIVPPVVQEWSLSTIKAMAETNKSGHPGGMMHQFSEKYGNVYQMVLLNTAIVGTHEPAHIKAVLAGQFDSFEKGPLFIDQFSSLLGTGVFNADGEMWKFHRAMTRPFFTRERISDFDIYHHNSGLSQRAVQKRIDEGLPIDFQDLVARFTLDSATEFLFGHSVGSLSAGIPYPPSHESLTPQSLYDHPSTAFVKEFSHGQVNSLMRLSYNANWPLLEFWKDAVKPARKVINDFTEPFIRQALEQREKELASQMEAKGEDETLLAHLVKHTQDPIVLQDEVVNLLVAGRDTTASLLTYSMYMLTQHPDVEKRLREEIFDKVGPSSNPTYEQMRDMKFMRAFLNEVLRLFPPVVAGVRSTNKPVTLPPVELGGKSIYVPPNTNVVYNIMNMQRRTDLWGPDALEFDPDRFLDHRLHKYLIPNPFIFTPFNAGPRICLGQQFAYHEATFFLVKLLQNFTAFTLDDSANAAPPAEWKSATSHRRSIEKIFLLSHLTLYVKDGLWVRMKELNSA